MNISEAIKRGGNILKKSGVKTYKLDCEILISQVFKKNRIDMILNSSKKLSDEQIILFNDLIEQRSKKKPVAYLVGKKEFWKYEFEVTKDVLIPRPDTEILIEQSLKITNHKSRLKILDWHRLRIYSVNYFEREESYYGTGIDISKKTSYICRVNVKKLNLFNRIRLFKSDVDNFRFGKYDLIISNPPYIKKFDLKYLERDIYDYEPKSALDGGLDGLLQIKKVIINSSKLIKKNGILILEIAFNQTDRVKKILKDNGYFIRDVVKDLAKNNRCIISIKK